MLTIGKEIRHTATMHKLFVSIAAALMSMFDVSTDVYTISYYKNSGKPKTAQEMTIFIFLSLFLQFLVVIAIHHKSKRRVVLELFATFTFTKPAFNKYRVLTNKQIDGHELVPPISEMMMFKLCEVFSESIPMTVVQVKNVLESVELDWIVLAALFTSVAFVSEAVSYMTFMKDISEEGRRKQKIFYGFIPLSGIKLVMVKLSMYLLSFCQLLGKSFQMVILMQMGGRTLALGVLGGEVFIYLLYKLLRRDFRYWIPLPRGTSLILSLVIRILMKVTADFTGFLHARHPYELGGFYWLLNMILTQVSVFASIKIKQEFGWAEGVEKDRLFRDEDYIKIATILMLLWLLGILGVFFSSLKDYRHTFYSLRTARELKKLLYSSGEDDIMITIFESHRSYYSSYDDEVREWLSVKWEEWYSSKPSFFTESLINRIPLDLIPGGGEDAVLDELDELSRNRFTSLREITCSTRISVERAVRSSLLENDGSENVAIIEKEREAIDEVMSCEPRHRRRRSIGLLK